MSPRKLYEKELKQLQEDVEEIGVNVQANYTRLFQALEKRDEVTIAAILKTDRDVHGMQRGIEGSCLNLITKQQPIARDLRQVTASLKVVTDISRIGDQCVDIGELVLRMKCKRLEEFSSHLPQMIEETRRQLSEAVGGFADRDMQSAQKVIAGDDIVDHLFHLVKEDLIEHLKADSKDSDDCIDILMIAKYLEKIGDHAVNIAEWTIFQETGEIHNIRLL